MTSPCDLDDDPATGLTGVDLARSKYINHIGAVFCTLALFEHTLVSALQMTRKIKLSVGNSDASAAERIIEKRRVLMGFTLGKLIKTLADHDASQSDLDYLRFVQRHRDYFVHRFFYDWPWPGELEGHALESMCRKLRFLEVVFHRATHRIWKILANSDFVGIVDLGEDGLLLFNDWSEGD